MIAFIAGLGFSLDYDTIKKTNTDQKTQNSKRAIKEECQTSSFLGLMSQKGDRQTTFVPLVHQCRCQR